MGLERAPFAEPVGHPEQEFVRLPVRKRCLHGRSIVGMHEALEPLAQHVAVRASQRVGHRLADVATSARAEDEDEIRGGRDERAEVRGLTASGADEGPRQQERQEESRDPEHDLDGDQTADVSVGGRRERPTHRRQTQFLQVPRQRLALVCLRHGWCPPWHSGVGRTHSGPPARRRRPAPSG